MSGPLRIAAMISGGGRTLLNIADHIDEERLDAEIAVVVSSRADAAGVARARARGLRVHVADRGDFDDDRERDDAIGAHLEAAGVDLVCLCGYLRLLRMDEPLVGRVINIHPALLPEFGGRGMYGDRVHRAVLAAGRTVSGCSVHYVDEIYDHGPVILQRECPVLPNDDVAALAARVFAEELIAFPEAIRLIAEGRVTYVDGRVVRLGDRARSERP